MDLQPLLSGNSPNCNADFSEPSSPAAADVVYDLILDPKPPAQVQANEALQVVALLTCDLAQQQNLLVAAFATLLSHTGEDKLLSTVEYGELVSRTTRKFCFTLVIPNSGKYRFKISVGRIGIGLYEDWLHVESEAITVTNNGGFLDNVYDRDLTEGEEAHSLVPLICREANDRGVAYDTDKRSGFEGWVEIFLPSQVLVGGIIYDKHIILIPESEIISVGTDLYDEPELHIQDFYFYGEGLFRRDGEWYGMDENEERSVVKMEDKVLVGDDGQKYRRGIRCFQQHYVGLRRMVIIIDTVRYIAHLVLYDGTKMAASHDKTLDLQRLLPGDSPRYNGLTDDFPDPSSTIVVPCLVLEQQLPTQVQKNKPIPIRALLTWDTTRHQIVRIDASATLISCTGKELLMKNLGNVIDYGQPVSPILRKVYFSLRITDLPIPDPGPYRFRISFQIGLCEDRLHVESKDFTITNTGDLFEDDYEAPKLVPLHCREMGDSEYAELEYAEHLPWKMSLLCKVVVGGITYDKRIVFIPEVEILRVETDLYDKPKPSHEGFFDYGEGLYIKDRVWYEIDEEENEILDSNDDSLVAEEDEILEGDDWQKYRKGVECFQDNYVGVQRVAVTIVGVPHIAHLVLYEVECYWEEYYWGVDLPDRTKIASAF